MDPVVQSNLSFFPHDFHRSVLYHITSLSLRLLGSLRGSWVHMAWHKNCVKKKKLKSHHLKFYLIVPTTWFPYSYHIVPPHSWFIGPPHWLNCGHVCTFVRVDEAVSGGKLPWLTFWVCITFGKVSPNQIIIVINGSIFVSVCRYTVHERCASRVPDHCITTYSKSRKISHVNK